jgi:hypothetical protein
MDEDGILAFTSLLKHKKETIWEVNIWQGDHRPTFVEDDSGALGHVFVLHVHRNSSVDMYQSFIKTYNLGQHMEWAEEDPGRLMSISTVRKHVLANLQVLLDATEWSEKENDAYRTLFHYNVQESPAGAIEAARVATKRFHVMFTPVCAPKKN